MFKFVTVLKRKLNKNVSKMMTLRPEILAKIATNSVLRGHIEEVMQCSAPTVKRQVAEKSPTLLRYDVLLTIADYLTTTEKTVYTVDTLVENDEQETTPGHE